MKETLILLFALFVAVTPGYCVDKKKKSAPVAKVAASSKEVTSSQSKSTSEKSSEPSKESNGEKRGNLSQAIGGNAGDKNVPVFIKSDTLSLDSNSRIFIYKNNVEIVKGDLIITADLVTGKYDANNQIDTITCEQNVVITRGPDLRASSDKAVYDVKTGTIVMTESPELNDKGNVLDADKVTIYINEDRSKAEGNVRVKVLKSEGGLASR